ncbi:MAG: PQQ-binding-like beta-propeller repeat protein [Micromonosporaceae bacterium]|nr:PQQ-binding-like beta-propeller repeat protein [Micromonosporaceae bacterium]
MRAVRGRLMAVAWPVLVVAGAAVAVGTALPWSDRNVHDPSRPQWLGAVAMALLAAVAVVAVATGVWYAVRRREVPFPMAIVGLLLTVAGVLMGQSRLRGLSVSQGIAVGGPLTLAALVSLLLGWALMVAADRTDWLGRPPAQDRWSALVAGVLTVALAGGTVAFIDWWRFGRLLDASTAAAPRAVSTANRLPASIDRDRWSVNLPGKSATVVAGDVVVRTDDGLTVLDAGSGAPRWHYHYRGRYTDDVVASDDGSVLVLRYDDALVGFDRATGRQLWWRTTLENADLAIAGDNLLMLSDGVLTDLNVHSGTMRWRHAAVIGPITCGYTSVATVPGTVVATVRCLFAGLTDSVVGINPETGQQRWRIRMEDYRPKEYRQNAYQLTTVAPDRVLATDPNGGGSGQTLLVDTSAGTLVAALSGVHGTPELIGDVLYVFGEDDMRRIALPSGKDLGRLPWPAKPSSWATWDGQILAAGPDTGARLYLLGPDGTTQQQHQLRLPGSPDSVSVGPGIVLVASSYDRSTRDGEPDVWLDLVALG